MHCLPIEPEKVILQLIQIWILPRLVQECFSEFTVQARNAYPENVSKKYFQRFHTADQYYVTEIKLPALEQSRVLNILLAYFWTSLHKSDNSR